MISIIIGIALFIYWVILLFKYEKDKKYELENINEEELFKKYNPLIAGCIADSREVLSRDIIAVILNLIEKGNIKYEIKKDINAKNENDYIYLLSKNKNKENEMDDIEYYIYNWVFQEMEENVELNVKLESLKQPLVGSDFIKRLNDISKEKINKMGANKNIVPKKLQKFNDYSAYVLCIFALLHMFYITYADKVIMEKLKLVILIVVLLGDGLISAIILIKILGKIRKLMSNITNNYFVSKVAIISSSILMSFALVSIPFALYLETPVFIPDCFIVTMCIIIIGTDNFMLKNNANMIEDFSRLNMLKNKLREYSTFGDKNFEHVVLWGKYFAYAISFGLNKKTIKKISNIDIDDSNIIEIEENEKLYDIPHVREEERYKEDIFF